MVGTLKGSPGRWLTQRQLRETTTAPLEPGVRKPPKAGGEKGLVRKSGEGGRGVGCERSVASGG